MAELLLQFKDVTGATEKGLLDSSFPISFTLNAGEIGVCRSGQKASALLRLAALRGILLSGSIEIMGTVIDSWEDPAAYLSLGFTKNVRSYIGFCHGHGGIIAGMSILRNVMLPANYHSGINSFMPFDEMARARLREIGVPEEFWDLMPADVLPEIQKRSLLARSVIHDPEILILEEPTESIPWSRTGDIIAWIRKQKDKGMGILIATNNDPFAGLIADWMVDLDNSVRVYDNNEVRSHLGDLVCQGSELLRKQVEGGEDDA